MFSKNLSRCFKGWLLEITSGENVTDHDYNPTAFCLTRVEKNKNSVAIFGSVAASLKGRSIGDIFFIETSFSCLSKGFVTLTKTCLERFFQFKRNLSAKSSARQLLRLRDFSGSWIWLHSRLITRRNPVEPPSLEADEVTRHPVGWRRFYGRRFRDSGPLSSANPSQKPGLRFWSGFV